MSDVTSWSTTAANNNGTPPDGWPEGMAVNALNNCGREMMRAVVKEAQINAVKVLASVSGTNTITASMTPDLAAYSAGMMVVLTPANNNTGAATLNIDALGALDIVKFSGAALIANDLVVGTPALLVLDSGADDWMLLNPQTHSYSGTYTPTVSNVANVSSVGTVETHRYTRIGSIVTVFGAVNLTLTAGPGVLTTFSVTLPVTSNLGAATDVVGTCADTTNSGRAGYVYGRAADDRALVEYFAPSSGITKVYYQFSYSVI